MIILELAMQIGLRPQWKASTAGGEYFSQCPSCGGTDRFYIQPHKPMSKCSGFYCCRRCGIAGDAIEFARKFLNLSFQDAAQAAQATLSDAATLCLRKPVASHATLQEQSHTWTAMATEYVEYAHQTIVQNPDALRFLAARGISRDIAHRYKFGLVTKEYFPLRSDWGLQEQVSAEGKQSKLWIPRGILIPISNQNGQVIRLKIRRHDRQQEGKQPKYVVIPGSMNGLSIIGDTRHDVLVVVESELDAYAIHEAASDFACVVAVGSNTKNPDNVTHYYAQRAPILLICYDNDDAGKTMFAKWRGLYPHAIGYPTPFGKDVGEAIQQGLNVRQWLLQAKPAACIGMYCS